jgi:hypothetical protein
MLQTTAERSTCCLPTHGTLHGCHGTTAILLLLLLLLLFGSRCTHPAL